MQGCYRGLALSWDGMDAFHSHSQPHTCEICQSSLLFFLADTIRWRQKGYIEHIRDADPRKASLRYNFWFNLSYSQAVERGQLGCELMRWLVTLGTPNTKPTSQLQAEFTNVGSGFVEHLSFAWVDKDDDLQLIYNCYRYPRRTVILCTEARYVRSLRRAYELSIFPSAI